VKPPVLWLAVGIVLIVMIATLNLIAIFGPAYIMGNVVAPCCSSPTPAHLLTGMRLYVTEIQKTSQLSLSSIYLRFALKTTISVGLLVLAVFLAFRKGWAWKSLFALMAVALLSFLILLVGAILRNPRAVTWGWFVESIGLDSLLLYGGVVFVFLKPSVRALYARSQRT
jgi:hypothetical protein